MAQETSNMCVSSRYLLIINMVSPDHTADFVIKTAEPETADIRVHATFPFTLRRVVWSHHFI